MQNDHFQCKIAHALEIKQFLLRVLRYLKYYWQFIYMQQQH